MTIKKILALIGLFLIITATAIILLNTFWPNPYTHAIITFATVTAPAYLMSKLEWVMGSIGATCSVIGLALKKINSTKDEAAKTVATYKNEADQAKNLASDQFGEVQKITEEKNQLQTQLNEANANKTDAEKLVDQQQVQIATLEKELQKARDDAKGTPVKIVEVVK